MNGTLTDKTVLVIGRGSGIARAVTEAARAAGAECVVAGRDQEKLAGAYDDPGISTATVDLTDDASIQALAGRLNSIDHVRVHRLRAGPRDARRARPREGPTVVRHQGDRPADARRAPRPAPAPGRLVRDLLRRRRVQYPGRHAGRGDHQRRGRHAHALARGRARADSRQRDLARDRRHGAWEGLGDEGKARLYAHATDTFPARRVGDGADIADAVLFCMTNTYLTGMTLKVDGGEALL